MSYTNTTHIRKELTKSNMFKNYKNLKPMPKLKIRCGLKGGLPFENLITDCCSGCLELNNVCYGNCTAAIFWYNKGYNFGKRQINIFDETLFLSDLTKISKNQKWFRLGWVSDCSFSHESWKIASHISELLNKRKLHLLIITKIHTIPSDDVLFQLAKNNTEIRVSLSALDTIDEIEKRLNFLLKYKTLGGISIPYLMSCKYKNQALDKNQQYIIDFIEKNNFLAGEHPLRVEHTNILRKELCDNGFSHPKYPHQYWFGRILHNHKNFILPPPTHLAPCYSLKYKSLTELKNIKYIRGARKNLPTYEDLKNNKIKNLKELNKHAAYSIQK